MEKYLKVYCVHLFSPKSSEQTLGKDIGGQLGYRRGIIDWIWEQTEEATFLKNLAKGD